MLTICLLNDVPIGGGGYPEIGNIWEIMDSNNVSEAEFHPYWEQREIKSDNSNVKISYYSWPGKNKILVIAGNMNKEQTGTKLEFSGRDVNKMIAFDVFETQLAGTIVKPGPKTPWNKKPVNLSEQLNVPGYGFRILELTE